MKSYLLALKKTFNFSGRTTRKDFWLFILIDIIILIIAFSIDIVIIEKSNGYDTLPTFSLIAWILPTITRLSAISRRLHDTGESFKMFWSGSISLGILGAISVAFPWLFIIHILFILGFFVTLSERSDRLNEYGPAPRGVPLKEAIEKKAEPNNSSSHCGICGTQLKPDDKFCGNCGTNRN